MPRPPRIEPSSRLNLELPQRTRDRLERLLVTSEADSRTEVIRRALEVYEVLLDARAKGEAILMRAGGTERELLIT